MAKESINGTLGKFMTVNGTMVEKKGTEYGKAKMEIHTSASGRTPKRTVTVFIPGHLGINMKVIYLESWFN